MFPDAGFIMCVVQFDCSNVFVLKIYCNWTKWLFNIIVIGDREGARRGLLLLPGPLMLDGAWAQFMTKAFAWI